MHTTYAGNPGLKKHVRCAQKTVLKLFKRHGQGVLTNFEENPRLNYENLCDMGRAGVCCRNVGHIVNALGYIERAVKCKEMEIMCIKNRFIESRNEGMCYRGTRCHGRASDY